MTDSDLTAAILRGDHHVHSTFSDDARSSLRENLDAAAARGLERIRLTEHVRRDTPWVAEFVRAARAESTEPGLTVLTGVEAKLLSVAGDIDAPDGLDGIDGLVLADHQFPGSDGPWSPSQTRERLASGLEAATALDMVIDASVLAMTSFDHTRRDLQLAHWFSILPKVGLDEDDLTDEHLERWAAAAADSGTIVEVNEKWACPGPRAVRAALAHGVRIVASTDSHVAEDVGRYESVGRILAEASA
ncbi:putative hydrolase [Microbacteriaceae bacterium SG_E_30_P1]|uniref:Hydrolase n=1 Tax=Antiquaquibacter oligotrophicus TaxID=2880260 RepID=A0ABT6KPZ9_9MICO|nr:PHP domain-containing protein [Antiquaquibacter oligotrophicus]MDH6181939.1 putative hydrolase [Antiquaquibacter oligotrophicus]UDF12391.1 PHP domain-containing protein [Antiquaquibacter oligotrophicus]